MERPAFRKPRLHFDTAPNPSHVTFDDGRIQRNLPWLHYNEARWERDEPGTIQVEFTAWLVVIIGYNLAPLYAAIEERTLLRLRAVPEFAKNGERDADTFATLIRFAKPFLLNTPKRRGGSPQLNLGLG